MAYMLCIAGPDQGEGGVEGVATHPFVSSYVHLLTRIKTYTQSTMSKDLHVYTCIGIIAMH